MLSLLFLACTVSQDKVTEVLAPQGFTHVQVDSYAWLGCSKDDTFKSDFTAVSRDGTPVEGVICCGVIKSCTVRW